MLVTKVLCSLCSFQYISCTFVCACVCLWDVDFLKHETQGTNLSCLDAIHFVYICVCVCVCVYKMWIF